MDDEEKKEYHDDYLKAMQDFTKDLEEGDRESVFETMEGIRYNPTNNPRQDAELNYLRSQKIVSGKKKKLGGAAGGAVASFLRHKAKADGMSQAAVDKWANKAAKDS